MLPVESLDYALAPKYSLKLGGKHRPGGPPFSPLPQGTTSSLVCSFVTVSSNGKCAFYGDSNKLGLADKPDGSYFGGNLIPFPKLWCIIPHNSIDSQWP